MPSGRSVIVKYSDVLSLIVRAVDAFSVLLCGALAYIWRFGFESFPAPTEYTVLGGLAAAVVMLVFPVFGVYRSWRGHRTMELLIRVGGAWLTVLLALVVLAFLINATEDYSRQWFFYWGILTLVALLSSRLVLALVLAGMRKSGWNHKRVVVFGAGELGAELIRRSRDDVWSGFDVIALFDDNPELAGAQVEGVDVTFGSEELEACLLQQEIDELWIALPLRAEARVRELMHELRHSTVDIRFVPDIYGFRLINHSVTEVLGLPMLDLSASPMTGMNRLVKGIEDRLLALVILVLISPLLLAIALAVKLSSPGPVLFKQKRHGWDGEEIKVYKFRSMKAHVEPEGLVTQATRQDPRITRLGGFLRRTSLDELPQFINVLQGRMSIVGPRPHAIAHNEQYKDLVDDYMQRHKVKPGITGWAQVNGYRGETDTLEKMQKRVEYDLYYIEHWSLGFDLKIILLTVFKGFISKNAY